MDARANCPLALLILAAALGASAQEAAPLERDSALNASSVGGPVPGIDSAAVATPLQAQATEVAAPAAAPTDSASRSISGTSSQPVSGAKTKIVVNIAVSDLVGKGVSQPEADLITEQVRANMLTTGTFKVMERSMMDQIMKEQGFQQSGNCDNSECMVEVGRVLGVQNLVVGSVGKVGRIFMMNVKIVDVSTGEVLKSLTETCECTIENLLQETPPKIAQALDREVRKGKTGTISVNTQPEGATVFLDDVSVGTTPWKSELLDPGGYKVGLVLPDWKRLEHLVQVQMAKEASLSFSLERSDEWTAAQRAAEERQRQAELARQDELRRQQEAAQRQKRLVWRVGLSALSALCVGGGYYFQTVADDNVQSADDAYERYRSTTDVSVMNASRSTINKSDDEAKTARTMRNIAYGLGAAAFSSITFTFFF